MSNCTKGKNMIRAVTRASVTLLAAAALATGSMAAPAHAVTATVDIATSATVPLNGGCLQLPVRIQPPSGATHWSVTTTVPDGPGSFASYAYGSDDLAATDELQHCASLHGVGQFTWTATLEWTNGSDETEDEETFAGAYVIHKATRPGTLKISDTTPKYGQRVKFRVCIPGPRYVEFKVQKKGTGRLPAHGYSSGSTGCDTSSVTWPKSKKAVKYRLYIPGDETVKPFASKWVTVRGHA